MKAGRLHSSSVAGPQRLVFTKRCIAIRLLTQPLRFWMAARPADAPEAGDKRHLCALEIV